MSDKKRIKELEIEELRQIIVHLDNCYHILGEDCINPIDGGIVSDNEYDSFRRRLEQIDPNWEGFKTTFSADKVKTSKDKIAHSPYMTSINKCNGSEEEKEEILAKWFKDSSNKLDSIEDGETFCMSYKHDGIALSVNYKDGKLVSAGLRSKSGGDGINVTSKTKNIKGIPQTLPLPLTLTIRGEIETHLNIFEKMNAKLEIEGKKIKSNARAYTAGMMNRKTAEEMKGMGLSFAAYNILNFEDNAYKTEIERAIWANEKLGLNFIKTIPFNKNMLKTFEENHRRLKWMVDGVVISVNNLEDQKKLGHTGNKETGNPRGKIAWKFQDEIKEVTVTSIEWQVGRTVLTPVLNFEGVSLEGTIVKKCSGHNLGIIENNKIGIGTIVGIIKSGKIIPKIKYVKEAKGKVEHPLFCPACEHPTKRIEGNNNTISLICDNSSCSARKVQNLNHYLKRIEVKGLAESTISKLCEAGLVSCPSDFYKLTLDKIKAIGIKERSATLILARVKMIVDPEQEKDSSVLLLLLDKVKDKKIPVKMETFISALCIDQAGRELGRILAEKYCSFEQVRNLSEIELEGHDGIGPITASSVCNYFKDNSDEVDELLKFINIEIVEKKSGILDGKKICLSGSLEGGKAKWKTLIEDNGGTIASSVSKKTDYLCAGDGSGSKSEKALKLNIPILTTEDLEKLLNS